MSKAAAMPDKKILADYDRLSPKRKKEVGRLYRLSESKRRT